MQGVSFIASLGMCLFSCCLLVGSADVLGQSTVAMLDLSPFGDS